MQAIDPKARQVRNFHTAAFETLRGADGRPSGASVLQLDRDQDLGVGFHLYKMESGTWSEAHEHSCDEQFIVLDGELLDHDGTRYRQGDFVRLKAGTRHKSFAPDGCLLAVFFEKPPRPLGGKASGDPRPDETC